MQFFEHTRSYISSRSILPLSTKLDNIAKTPVLLGLLVATVIFGAALFWVEPWVGGEFLDLLADSDAVLCRLEEMSESQRDAHRAITLTIDSVYPLLYGAFLIGIVWRLTSANWRWLVTPAILAVVLDFTENLIQVVALSGETGLLGLKELATPFKFACVITALAIAAVLLVVRLRTYCFIAASKQ